MLKLLLGVFYHVPARSQHTQIVVNRAICNTCWHVAFQSKVWFVWPMEWFLLSHQLCRQRKTSTTTKTAIHWLWTAASQVLITCSVVQFEKCVVCCVSSCGSSIKQMESLMPRVSSIPGSYAQIDNAILKSVSPLRTGDPEHS